MKRKIAIAAGVAAAVVAIIVAFIAWPRGASPVTESEALEAFRARTETPSPAGAASTTTTAAPATTAGAPSLPAFGVYAFAATGGEEVKLGLLPSESRTYPASVPVTVAGATGSCFTVTLNLLEPHTEDTTYCATSDGTLQIQSHTKHQRIGAVSPTAEMTCNPGLLYRPGGPSQSLECKLSLSSGPAQMSATAKATATATAASAQAGGATIPAIKLEVTYTFNGDITGSWTERTWFATDRWLPLRIERELDMKGLATFKESSTLNLSSIEPRR